MTLQVEDFGPFKLSENAHSGPEEGMCVMEMVSFLAGEDWSDTPQCSSPVVSSFCQVLNDRMGQDFRDKLQTYVPRLIGTVSPEHDQERVEYLAWQAIKVFAPIALDAAGLTEHAEKLRGFDVALGLSAANAAANAAARAAACAHAADAADAAAYAAAYADDDADDDACVAAADAAAYAADAAFEVLDGLLEIGPCGQSYEPVHAQRAEKLKAAVSA